MRRRLPLTLAVLAVLLAVTPASSDPGTEKAQVDARLGEARQRLEDAARQVGVLTDELSAVTERVRAAQADVDAQQARLVAVEAELVAQRVRRERLDAELRVLADRLVTLRGQEAVAVARLERRVREIYMADEPDPVAFVVGAASFTDLLDNVELLDRIGRQDRRISDAVHGARERTATAEASVRRSRAAALETERVIAARAAEQRVTRDRLAAGHDALAAAEHEKSGALASIRHEEGELQEEVEALRSESAELAAKIRAAQPPPPATPEEGGPAPAPSPGAQLAWPVSGPVVSGFGPRGGSLHEGIDIIVAAGTPVHAAAAGTVIHVGWLGGYGNLVVVDHGGGLATAYAHNSAYTTSVGQTVAQGDVIALSGNTGNSSGPHVHFEVRVNGTAVDPLGYL